MINNSDTKTSYQGNGVTNVFPFTFPFIDKSYIHVALYDSLTETSTILTSDYFVDANAKTVSYPGYAPGQAPAEELQPPVLPSTSTITIYRDTEVTQLTDLGEKYPLPQIEAMSDKLTEIIQELLETLSRTVKVPIGDPKSPDEKLTDLQEYVKSAAASALEAGIHEVIAQQAREAAEAAAANAQQSMADAGNWAELASVTANIAEQAAISARAYSAPPYDNTVTYHAGDVVTYVDGSSYRAIADTTGNLPTDTTYWTKVTSYVGDDFWLMDASGYIVPNSNPTYSGRWAIDDDGYIVPINNVA